VGTLIKFKTFFKVFERIRLRWETFHACAAKEIYQSTNKHTKTLHADMQRALENSERLDFVFHQARHNQLSLNIMILSPNVSMIP
jgi:hypothetical protein